MAGERKTMMTLDEFQAYCRANPGPSSRLDFSIKLGGTVFLMSREQMGFLIVDHRAAIAEHAKRANPMGEWDATSSKRDIMIPEHLPLAERTA